MTRWPEIAGLGRGIVLLHRFVVLGAAVLLALRRAELLRKRPIQRGAGALGGARGRYGTPLKLTTSPATARTPEIAPEMKRDEQAAVGRRGGRALAGEAEGGKAISPSSILRHARELLAAGVGRSGRRAAQVCAHRVAIGKAKVHGEGRLELAELARASGDLTDCLRALADRAAAFLGSQVGARDGGGRRSYAAARLPTDWVLNDF